MRIERDATGTAALGALFETGPVAGLTDGELLGRWLDGDGAGSELAIAALVDRHSGQVWRACRSAVANDADASDAFQATFVILLRRARAIRRRESVASWLAGVARRVAAQARVNSARRRAREQVAAGRAEMMTCDVPAIEAGEVAAIVRDELGRLSARDRAVVLACDLDGLTETEAARRLDCPVGTIRSRLFRARSRLRRRFTARGLDPTAALAILPTFEVGKIPATLVAGTVALALRAGAAGSAWAQVGPVAVTSLVLHTGRSWLMLSLASTGTILLALVEFAPGPLPAPKADLKQDPPATKPADPPAPVAAAPKNADAMPDDPAERFRKLVFEYDLARLKASTAGKAGKTNFEQHQLRHPLQPDETAFARRMIDLALLDPPGKVARDAAIWVMDKTWMSEAGAYGGEYETAVSILINHHADDPEAVRVGLQLDGIINRRRDAFLEGCYANATSHESKGLARLAYAQYLEHKVPLVRGARNFPKRSEIHYEDYDATGKLVAKTIPEGNESFAYDVSLRWIDPDAMQAEVDRLYHEVIAEYADVRYINRGSRRIEAELAQPTRPDGSSLSRIERGIAQQMLQSKTTLADVARSRLKQRNTLAAGKSAPEVAGVDLITGKPFKLSDYRGQTVLLFFWADIADRDFVRKVKERVNREREQGRPLQVIGVVSANDPDAARQLVEHEQVPWSNLADGNLSSWGPIGTAYQIQNIPWAILIDPTGKIAVPRVSRSTLDVLVDQSVQPAAPPQSPE